MRAKLMTIVLCAACMAAASQVVAVAEPANTTTTQPPAVTEGPMEVQPVGRPQVDDASSEREKQLVGAKVISVDEKEAGYVSKIIDDAGSTKAVVEYPGLLGVGEKRVAIPIADFTLISEGRARVTLSQSEIKSLPGYEG